LDAVAGRSAGASEEIVAAAPIPASAATKTTKRLSLRINVPRHLAPNMLKRA
jgi:hypothetical protein